MKRAPALLAWTALAVTVLALPLADEPVLAQLRYQRGAILDGELWRLLTAHWVHLSLTHAALNLLALGLIMTALGGEQRPWRSLWALMGCQLGVSLGLLVFSPDVDWYVGLSGALHGHILVLAFMRVPVPVGPAVLVSLGVAGKVAWESVAGPSPGVEFLVGGPVLVTAHLYGALSGAALAGPSHLWAASGGRRTAAAG